MTSLRWGTATDAGRVRDGNEDFALAVDGLFVVADGMGGHQAGETASHLAVETVQARFTSAEALEGAGGELEGADEVDGRRPLPGAVGLVRAVEQANQEILRRAETDEELEGMGTTLCALAVVRGDRSEQLAVVNVGDSRLYLLTDAGFRQVTEDHSLVATLQRQGRLTPAEAAVHPQRNILTRALGIEPHVMVDSWELEPRAGDRYLLCTDGLFNEVDDGRLAATLRKIADPTEVARELVRIANESGGRDNITAVVVDVVGTAGATGQPEIPAPPDVPAPARPEGDGSGGDVPAGESPPRARRFTWRVAVFLVALLAIVGAAVGITVYGLSTEDAPPPTTTTTTSSTTTTTAVVVEPPAPPAPPDDQPGVAPGVP